MREQKYSWIRALSGVAIGILFLGFSDTARSQTVTLSGTGVVSNAFSVTVQHGSVSPVQAVNVATTEGSTPIDSTVNIQVNAAATSWLQVAEAPNGNNNVSTPVTLHITVNAASLAQGTLPSGTITITPPIQADAVTLTVNVTVSGNSLLSSNPASLSFTTTVGTPEANVPTQQVTIASSGPQLTYTVSTSTQNGVFWLIPSPSNGTTGNSTTDIITVGVNPSGLATGVYQGTITVQSTTTVDSVAINVTLTVAPNTTLSVTPATLQPFLYQIGTTAQAGQLTQTLQVSSNNASVDFQVAMSPVVSWLVISPSNGATGTAGQAVPVTLSVNPSGLSSGVYNTQITVSIIGGAALAPIPVQLVISTNPLLSLSTNTLSFVSQFGGTAPPASQAVQVSTVGSSTSVSFSVSSDSSWLTWTAPSLNTPGTITVSVNPSSLAVGPYTGHLTVRPSNSDANLYSLTITVNLTVGNTAQVSAGPPLLVFAWETSQPAPSSQVVELLTQGQPTTFLLTSSVTTSAGCPAGWLSATTTYTSTQNATITVSANVTGMSPGVCPGVVTVSYPASSLTPQTLAIPITMNVSNSALLNVSFPLGFGNATLAQGAAEITQAITLTSTDPSVQVTDISAFASSSGGTWLFLGQNGTSTPQSLQVIINPGTLPANTYGGTISISSSKLPSSPLSIPVTLTVTSSTTVAVSPLTLTFNQASGGSVPTAQNVTLTSSATGATFQTSIPSTQVCSWLQVTPTSGAASGTVAFSVLTNSLPQNSYQCPVTFSFLNSATAPVTVSATLVVGASQTLTVAPTSLTFAYQVAGSTPASQPLTVTSTGGSVAFTASATSNGGWLDIDTTSSATGTAMSKVINVSINPVDFPSGTTGGSTLTGSITISAPGVLSTPITVTVTVNVTAAAVPSVVQIINSATFGFGAIAPGELIAIRGANLGPACVAPTTGCVAGGYQFTVNAQGTVNSTLAGVQVLFNGTPGTPTYVSPTQINVIVPWEVAGFAEVNMVVSYNTVQSPVDQLQVVAVAPGIYTQNATGAGQAAVLNLSSQASSAYNGPAGGTYFGTNIPTAPAPAGSAVVLYLTGGGLTNPGGTDGTVTPDSPLQPLKNWTVGSSTVTATVGGVPATVVFAGAAPTLITGVVQINLQLPAGVTGAALPVVITIDGQTTQTNATIAIQ